MSVAIPPRVRGLAGLSSILKPNKHSDYGDLSVVVAMNGRTFGASSLMIPMKSILLIGLLFSVAFTSPLSAALSPIPVVEIISVNLPKVEIRLSSIALFRRDEIFAQFKRAFDRKGRIDKAKTKDTFNWFWWKVARAPRNFCFGGAPSPNGEGNVIVEAKNYTLVLSLSAAPCAAC